jgi:hypothetical protein
MNSVYAFQRKILKAEYFQSRLRKLVKFQIKEHPFQDWCDGN